MTETEPPRVVVVMPLYNAAPYVEAAIDSVLAQTWGDFEVVVVDDGSDDGGPELVERVTDPRVRLLRLASNGGIARALNAGIAASRAPIVARMDADDISFPDRFARQLAVLDSRPEVGAVGCTPLLLTESGEQVRVYPVLASDAELRRLMPLQGPFAHGSVMFRREVFEQAGPYRSEEEPAEDYALWIRVAGCSQLANLCEPLYGLRLSSGSVSARNRHHQLVRRRELRERAWQQLEWSWPRRRELRRERARYEHLVGTEARPFVERHARLHQELAVLRLRRPGLAGWWPLAVALSLGPASPRTLSRVVRFWWAERQESRSLGRAPGGGTSGLRSR